MISIRKAAGGDAERILFLLRQVLEVHAAIRPDIFITGTTKYEKEELLSLLDDEKRYSYVASDERGTVLGYALCELKDDPGSNVKKPRKSMYVDDICVDESARGQGVGTMLFDHVKKEAEKLGCRDVTLCVWEGNDAAKAFYDKMGMKPRDTQMELILK